MQWLASLSVRRPVLATVLMLIICVLGFTGATQLGVDRFPNVDFPTVSVVTRLPGATPDQMETDVTDKIEEAVNTLSGIDELRSISSEGVSQVIVTFELSKNIDVAAQEIKDKIAEIRSSLPDDIEEPTTSKVEADATPILYLAVKAQKSTREITDVADKLVRRELQTAPGVGQVSLLGGAKRQINVRLDPVKLREYGLTALDARRAISGQNLTVPGGRLDAGPEQLSLRIKGRVGSPDELNDIVVAQHGEHPVRLRDVARVEDGSEIVETKAVRDGASTVMLSVRKQSGSNSVAVVDALNERVKDLGPRLPAGFSLEVVRDNTATIRTSAGAVIEHLVLGGILTAVVVLIFLGSVRSTAIAAIAIPVSIIGTFALMWVQDFTMNTITLLALALAVGMVIDDAIVVLENVHRHIEEKHSSPRAAAVNATKEIGLAVLATTLSLLAVFVPVAFMSGIVGRFLQSFGLTMAFAIAVSMLVSFTLTPMLAARWLKKHAAGGARPVQRSVLERMVDYVYRPIERVYMVVLTWVMRHRWVVVTASLASLAATVPLLQMVDKGFLPRSDEAHFEINLRAPEGTSLEATALLAERMAREVRKLSTVTHTVVTIGDNVDRSPNVASVYVKLQEPGERRESQNQIMERVRKEILPRQPAELKLDVSDVPMISGGGKNTVITYEISGPDHAKLTEYAERMVERMKKIPGLVDASTTAIGGKPELAVRILRDKAANLGVRVQDVADALNLLVGGVEVSTYEESGETIDVHLRADDGFRADSEGLQMMSVPSSRLGSVPLLDVVKLDDATGPSRIDRLNRRRQVALTANVAPGYSVATVLSGVVNEVKALNMPSEYKHAPAGQSKEMGRAGQAFLLAFGLSLIFMYLVLAAQFESWLHPVTILLCLPLTLPFALISLMLFGLALDIYSALGLLVLFGVVKKNSILQIDHTNQLRSEGLDRMTAILDANRDRLRPILMTTAAFVAGMLPLMFSHGVGAGFNRATAGVIVGGQMLSLLLTLLATPVAYSLFDDLAEWLRARFGRKPEADEEAEASVGELPVPAMDS